MLVCKVCGKEYTDSPFYDSCRLCSDECFYIDHWNNALDDKAIIIDGECYHDGGNKPTENRSYMLGCAGRVFRIRFKKDNRIIETNNLWRQGKIPPERNVPDNAEFVKEVNNGDY